jgi:hypothetical protein
MTYDIPENAKYIIDTCSLFSQKNNEQLRSSVYKSLWDNIDSYLKNNKIIISYNIKKEIDQDDELHEWVKKTEFYIVKLTEEVQLEAKKILKNYPKILNLANL